MHSLAQRLFLALCTLVVVALFLTRAGAQAQDHSRLTEPIMVLGFLGGAFIAFAGPLFNEEFQFEPLGCAGWVVGLLAALACSRIFHNTADTWFLLIPVGAATFIQVGSILRRRRLATSPLLPVLFGLLALGAYVGLYIKADVHRATLLTHIFGIATVSAVLQVLLSLGSPRQDATSSSSDRPTI